jgi:hypothetical protein
MIPARETIEFKACDGTMLRGWFYPQAEKSPCVIMTHGVRTTSDIGILDTPMKLANFCPFDTNSWVVSATIGSRILRIDSSELGTMYYSMIIETGVTVMDYRDKSQTRLSSKPTTTMRSIS